MIGHKLIYIYIYEKIVIAKKFGTYVSLKNFGFFSGEVHCSPGKLAFLEEQSYPWGQGV
jgi:hypothetical protein